MGRPRGSARFDPYFKLQRWDDRTIAWVDVQRSFHDEHLAAAYATRPGRWRIMRVTMDDRWPVANFTVAG
jgi:hypothetical protein